MISTKISQGHVVYSITQCLVYVTVIGSNDSQAITACGRHGSSVPVNQIPDAFDGAHVKK